MYDIEWGKHRGVVCLAYQLMNLLVQFFSVNEFFADNDMIWHS